MGSIHKYVTHVVLRTQHRYSVKYEEYFCNLYIQNSSRCSKARSQTIMGSIHKYVTHVVLRTQHRYSVKYEEYT